MKAEALAVAARVAEDFPKDAFAHALLATVHYNHGNSAEALRCFDRCLQLDPTLADVCNLMGRVAHQKGDLDRAVTLYRQALRINPRMPDASYDLGRALLDLGRAEELIATMQEAIKACGRSTAHCYLLGQGYLLSKQYEKAKESLLAATEIDPSHIQAHFGLFTACSRLGQQEKATELSPKEPDGYRALAELFLAPGRSLPEAKSLASKLVELEVAPPHYFLLAKACARNGDRAGGHSPGHRPRPRPARLRAAAQAD